MLAMVVALGSRSRTGYGAGKNYCFAGDVPSKAGFAFMPVLSEPSDSKPPAQSTCRFL